MTDAVIVTMSRYPDGDAGALRMHALAIMLRHIGVSPFVIGLGTPTLGQGEVHEGIPYISLRSSRTTRAARIFNHADHARRLERALHSLGKIDIFLCDQVPLASLVLLRRASERQSGVIIYDAVEWYSPTEFSRGRWSSAYQTNNLFNERLIDERFRAVTISRYLESHFQRRGLRCARVPIVKVPGDGTLSKTTSASDKLRLLYAGSPGKKDELAGVIAACALLPKDADFELRIIGTSLSGLLSVGVRPDDLEELGSRIVVEQRRPRVDVLEAYAHADFSVLFRRASERYAQAGFPTKFTESLAMGTPVILNLSSDLDLYADDGKNALVARDHEVGSVLEVLKRALALTPDQRLTMSIAAERLADERLDYRLYTHALAELLE